MLDLSGELERLGSVELLRLEMAHWLLGASAMQVLMAEGAAIDAGVDPARITLAAERLLSGANCDGDDHMKVVFAQLLAKQLEHLLMVLATDSVKGRAQMPLLIHPCMLITNHLAALLQAGSDNLVGDPARSYADQISQAARELKGAVEVLEELAAKARAQEGSTAQDHRDGKEN